MLTKELVQATVRSGKLYPKFIKPDDMDALRDATKIREAFEGVTGRILQDIEDDLKEIASTPRTKAFAKLLFDQCDIAEPDAEVMDLRWQVFEQAEKSRINMDPNAVQSLEVFTQSIADRLGLEIGKLKSTLFSDLPSARQVENFKTLSASDLLNRYNLSHVSTFLCFASEVSITVKNISLPQKRELMRKLKFHRLMSDVEVNKESNSITLELSGPLQIFGKTSGYTLRIANFFLFVASLPEWSVNALVRWKNKSLIFEVDQKSGVKNTSARGDGGYIPKEFEQVIEALNNSDGINVDVGAEFVHLGKQSYCFPDFVIKSPSSEIAVELFHPWHKGQLVDRIKAASAANAKNLLLGVERSLFKDPHIKSFCAENPWFANHGFDYSQFPTPTIIKRQIAKHVQQ